MNIKRRVYDALNVLIALGLLKRNGNKIAGKRTEDTVILRRPFAGIEKGTFQERDEVAEDRQQLSQQICRKEQIIAEKRQMLEGLTMKMNAMKELQTRNKTHPSNKTRVKMPFVALCAREGELKTEESHL